jgi:hypothetical protein
MASCPQELTRVPCDGVPEASLFSCDVAFCFWVLDFFFKYLYLCPPGPPRRPERRNLVVDALLPYVRAPLRTSTKNFGEVQTGSHGW